MAKKLGFRCDEILFVGDHYENDYLGPRRVGMKAILIDRKKSQRHRIKTIRSLYELLDERYLK
jgi:putative hydrolase of the HAD superfamily